MNRCVSDDTLLLLHEGAGTRAHQVHLASCESCRARSERLARDLRLIGQVLREPPLVEEVLVTRPFLGASWVAGAAVSVALLFLVWGRGWMRDLPFSELPSRTTLSAPASSGEVRDEELAVLVVKTVTPALFSATELGGGKLPKHATNLAYLKAALDGGWPSERCEPARSQTCEGDPFVLFFDE